MTDTSELYNIRNATEKDLNFILATFLRGVYYGDTWFSKIPKDIFMDNYKKVILSLLSSPRAAVKIACLPDDEDVILGYSILSADYKTIHWVYVKSIWRRKGIARSLVPKHPDYVSHLSALGNNLLDTKFENVVFNPFSL